MKKSILILFSLSIFQLCNCKEKQFLYRCGTDDEDIKPLPATNFIPIKKDNRKLDNEEFKDFHIHLDLLNIKKDIITFGLEEYEDLFIDSMNKAVKTLQSLLRVKKSDVGFVFTDDQIANINIQEWNKSLIGTNAIGHTGELGIDLFIFGRVDDQMELSTLATAGPKYFDPNSGRPLVGVVNINKNVNYSKINSREYFQSIVIHEFTHILGFLSYYFINHMHNMYSKIDEYNITRYYINSSKVLEVARKYYNCSDIDGVELEESGGGGTAASHWEARILLGEYMNGVIYTEEQVISEFTLALLEDSGYYKPNYYTGGLMRYGKGKGCDFIKKRCVDSNHEINPLFENEFYDSIKSPGYMDASCSSGSQSRAYHAWWAYNNLPEHYRYFYDGRIGGFSPADYYPVSMGYAKESENAYYTSHCSLKGNGGYGSRIAYEVTQLNENGESSTIRYYNTSGELYSITG